MVIIFELLFIIWMHRVCIYSKDIEWITGKSPRCAREIIRDIKLLHLKSKHQLVTIEEFCDYMGLPYTVVFNMINKIKGEG